jgi:hypothetical protein
MMWLLLYSIPGPVRPMRRIAMLPLLAIVLMPLPARAQDDAGMEKPTEIASVIRAKRPYGVGTYTYYMMTVYQAALWTDEPNWSMQAPFAFSQKYDVDVPKGTIVDRTAAEMQLYRHSQWRHRDFPFRAGQEIDPVS